MIEDRQSPARERYDPSWDTEDAGNEAIKHGDKEVEDECEDRENDCGENDDTDLEDEDEDDNDDELEDRESEDELEDMNDAESGGMVFLEVEDYSPVYIFGRNVGIRRMTCRTHKVGVRNGCLSEDRNGDAQYILLEEMYLLIRVGLEASGLETEWYWGI
ncbi:hypothetical protein L211DRAFT_854234 [Terfezia boudieri ATCC MYA-4762]|uniref:Uncharacterized protein n=1 Tax=Terfezia boudieri ATCC MYA-4762 TaxID=1051890 RepID=A0A3N4L637_9PEZI|nr:hypothetical protein L211DRAFT_854234 [Terfezia boudieri ATCC MYA-4762]